MPTFLSDPPDSIYLILGAIALVAAAIWFNRRDRRSQAVVGGSLALLLLLFIVDRLAESPREEAVRRALAMVKAADTQNPDAFLSHIADKLEYQGESGSVTITRDQLRALDFWKLLKQWNVHVAAWDFSRDDVTTPDESSIEIGFLAKGEADGKQAPIYLRARFTRQPNGQYLMTALSSYDALKRSKERKTVPYFPTPGSIN